MKIRNLKTALIMTSLIIIILACGLPSSEATVTPDATSISDATLAPSSDATVPPAGNTIQHEVIPINLPTDRSSKAGDFDSSTTADKKSAAGGDRFTFGRFERPFNANTMDVYFSQLDIVDTLVFQDETWIYGTIKLNKPDPTSGFNGKYALEIDADRDGKGDWLVIASNPASTEWSVEGVQIYQDTNKDVGNVSPMFADEKVTGDGFETLVFDQGTGADADSAWVRISPNDPNTLEFSVKRSVLNNPEKYLINMWAGTALLDPALFDLNDHFTHEQAGAADPGLPIFYPIKGIAELDNSCRMAVGFEPTGQEPGLCEVFIPNIPGAPGVTACTRPSSCSGCGRSWDQATCTCSQVPC
jgi:hypothetical protein